MKTFVIIPTYNERANIVDLISEIFAQPISDLHIIVVDDNSPDKTAEAVAQIQTTYPGKLYLINRYHKLGLGSAYIAGFKKAMSLNADLLIEMDADFSHDPKDLPRLAEACTEGFDLAIGSRKIAGGKVVGWSLKRKLMSNGAALFSRILLGLKTKDVTAGYRCFKRQVLEKINLDTIKSNGYAFQEELLYRTEKLGFTIKEIPVIFKDREVGQSKLGKKEIKEFFVIIFKLRFLKV